MCIQLKRPPAFPFIAPNVIRVVKPQVAVSKTIVRLPAVPPAAIVILQQPIKALVVFSPVNHVFDPPIVIAPQRRPAPAVAKPNQLRRRRNLCRLMQSLPYPWFFGLPNGIVLTLDAAVGSFRTGIQCAPATPIPLAFQTSYGLGYP